MGQYLRTEVGLYAIAVGNIEVFRGKDGMDWKAKIQPGVRISAKAITGKDDSKVRAEVDATGEGRLTLYLNDLQNSFYGGADGEVEFTAALVFFNRKYAYERQIPFGGVASSTVMRAGATLNAPPHISLASEGYAGGETWRNSQVSALLPSIVPRAFVRVNAPESVNELSTANNTSRAGRGFTGGGVIDIPFRMLLPAARK